ncbi:MAG: LLM class flavin-dependent oxidoreductase, partial [Propionibacterium sp.]|nr:LLM class flavin-dependent oxidoreductase [Propionibacterium sp.]
LAKVAATCDHISGGRIEMGIGGGWYEHEWRAYGYGFPEVGDRLRMLREGVEIFRQAWTTGKATLDGRYYRVDGAIVQPRPLQDGPSRIPLWIAGGGEKVTLRIAAHYADYTNFFGQPDGFARRAEILAGHCRDLGTDYDRIVKSSNFNTVVAGTEAEVEDKIRALEDRWSKVVPADTVRKMGNDLRNSPASGTPEQVAEQLTRYQQAGLQYTITYFPDAAYDRSSLEQFAAEVAPALS